jgi:hypothetical protein
MAAINSSETLITIYKTTLRQNPEDHVRHLHRRENLKPQNWDLYELQGLYDKFAHVYNVSFT